MIVRLKRERCADETEPDAILVSFRQHVGHKRLGLEIGTPTARPGVATVRDVYREGGRMGKVSLGEQGHAMLTDIDGANPVVKVNSVRVGALNPNGQF